MGRINLSYLTGRLVKSGPTKVGLVIIRFHPERSLAAFLARPKKDSVTLLGSLLSGLDNLEHFLLSNASDLGQWYREFRSLFVPLVLNYTNISPCSR